MSSYLLAPLLAWIVAQGAKYVLATRKSGGSYKKLSTLYETGGMPSSHTAIVTALVVTVAADAGVSSPAFAVAMVLAVIVIHDALQARRAIGEQGVAVRQLLLRAKLALTPYQALGHRPSEVIAGALVGALVAVATLYIS